jgi:large conductance mechanosensitive channel
MSILAEFKEFVAKGNVMDLAVGVIIGAAFKSVVDAMVKDVVTPIIALAPGGGTHEFAQWKLGPVMIGDFLNTVLSFVIMAAVVFFFIVKPMNSLMARLNKPAPAPAPVTPEDVLLLREIRDTLKADAKA